MSDIYLPERLLGENTPAIYAPEIPSLPVDYLPRGLLGQNFPEVYLGEEGIVTALSDSFAMSDTLTAAQKIALMDNYAFSSAFAIAYHQSTVSLTDEFIFSETFRTTLHIALADAFAMTDAISIDRFLLAISDAYSLSDSFLPVIQATLALVDTFGMTDTLAHTLILGMGDAFAMADSFVAKIRFIIALADAFAMTDAYSDAPTFVFALSDSFGMTDMEFVPRLEATLALSDSFSMVGAFSISDEEKYLAWVVNTATGAPYKFQNYPFNSFASASGGKQLGCAADGVYELTGDDDAGESIGAYLKTGLMDFGTERTKFIDEAYLAYSADGSTLLKLIFSENGTKTESWYELKKRPADILRNSQVPIHRGIEAVYFQFELHLLDGKPARYEQLILKPMITKRMI